MNTVSQKINNHDYIKLLVNHPLFNNEKTDLSLRSIYEKITYQLQGYDHPVIGIFSSVTKEGSTSILLKLVQIASQNRKKVLIIDIGKGGALTKWLNLSEKKGIHDIEDESLEIKDIVIPADINGISVIPFGKTCFRGSSYLSLKTTIAELKKEWDITMIDLPPIFESLLAAQLSDGVIDKLIWVIAAHRTRRETIQQAKAELEEYGKPILLGTILNMREYFIPRILYSFS